MRRVGVIAAPAGVRWLGFSAAASRAGFDAECLPWSGVLSGAAATLHALASADLVRIDSPADDPAVDTVLCGRRRDHGEVLGAASWVAGLTGGLRTVMPMAKAWAPHPDDVADLMDKAACHARLRLAGLPVVPALRPVADWGDLLAAMSAAGWGRVFVKPRFGSGGCGVIALAISQGRYRAISHLDVEPVPGGIRLYNRSRPLVMDDGGIIAAVVDTLAPEGLHVERWAPKLVMRNGPFDLRIVCVAGTASHAVARLGTGPVTNLHAGGRRLPLADARAALGPAFNVAVDTAERVAAVFPRCLQLGVDVGVLADRRTVVVFEANAFGDHLFDTHDLSGRPRTTWDVQVAALAKGWEPASVGVAA